MTSIVFKKAFRNSENKNIVVYCGEHTILTANRVKIEQITMCSTLIHIRVHYTETYVKDVYIDPYKVTHVVVE